MHAPARALVGVCVRLRAVTYVCVRGCSFKRMCVRLLMFVRARVVSVHACAPPTCVGAYVCVFSVNKRQYPPECATMLGYR